MFLLVLLTKGVIPFLNKLFLLLILTILKMTFWNSKYSLNKRVLCSLSNTHYNFTNTWSCLVFSTTKLNHSLCRGLQVSGRMKRSYSYSHTKSILPKLPIKTLNWIKLQIAHLFYICDKSPFSYMLNTIFTDNIRSG